MNQRIIRSLLALVLVLGLATVGFAQRQTGSLYGTVIDNEKNPLPGASVTISGPSLLGTNIYQTTHTGAFRFPSLLPGAYGLRVELQGFKTQVRTGIYISVGKTTEVEIILELGTLEQEVTVLAASPVVDLESTKMSVNYTAEFLTSIPMNRDLYDIQNSIPGAISEGVDYRRTSSILGGTVRSQLYALDGVPMNDPATFYSMANINVDVYQEIEFEVGSHPAEVGQTDSTYVNIVTKSGGNKLTGTATTYYTGKSLVEDLFTPEQMTALAVNRPESYTDSQDYSLSLGGPILSDKLWFFLNGRRYTWKQLFQGAPELRMERIGVSSTHYDLAHQEWMGFAKLTFQITKNIRYMGMLHYNHIYEPVYSNSAGTDTDISGTEVWDHENTYTTTHQFNVVLNPNTFLDIRGTYVWRNFPIPSLTHDAYSYYDYAQNIWWGQSPYSDEYIRKKYLASASITSFQDDFLGASHEFKAGVEFEQSEYHRDWWRWGNPYYSYWNNYLTRDPYYASTSRKQGYLRVRICPGEPGQWDVQDHVRRFSGFVQDSAQTGRLSINVGLRFDWSYQYEPEQTRPQLTFNYAPSQINPAITDPMALLNALIAQYKATIGPVSPFDALTTPWKKVVDFKTFSPRIGLVYDLFGNGKTALKLSFARYFEPVWSAKYNGAQIFGASSVRWRWTDTNSNKLMDLPPTDLYEFDSAFSNPEQDPNFTYYLKDLKAPYTDEVIAGLEREVLKDFKVGLEFMYRINKNIVEDYDTANGYDTNATDEKGRIWLPYTFTDPGWDGLWGTSDDKQMTIYGLRLDRPATVYMGGNPPEAKRKYWAVILTFDKRMSNKWQFSGSILYSSFKGNCDPGYSATEGESTMFDNPNVMINSYGALWADRPLQIKLMGSYILPLDFVVSAYLQYRDGSPWAQSLGRVYFPANFGSEFGGVTQTYYTINAEEPGARRNRAYTNLDLRLEKKFTLSRFNLNIYMDVFNVAGYSGLNVNQDPSYRLRYDSATPYIQTGPTYKQITSVYGVRSVRLGVRIGF